MKRATAIVLVVAALLAGCTKTVEWQEEVALNTGERLWLARRVTYERYGDNPLALGLAGWRPRVGEEVAFQWNGRRYEFRHPEDRPRPMVLYIDLVERQPVFVVSLHWRACRKPHFTEWQATASGWQERGLSASAHGLPKNLMRHRPGKPAEAQSRYPAARIAEVDAPLARSYPAAVDPEYLPRDCRPRRP